MPQGRGMYSGSMKEASLNITLEKVEALLDERNRQWFGPLMMRQRLSKSMERLRSDLQPGLLVMALRCSRQDSREGGTVACQVCNCGIGRGATQVEKS